MITEFESCLIQADDIDSPEKLASVVTSVWARENRGFYLTLFSRCNDVTRIEPIQLVDRALQEETRAIAADILENPDCRNEWRQWLGWINLLQLLMKGFDPLKLPRMGDGVFVTEDLASS